MQEACEFGESRDAQAHRLSDKIHANRSEITRAGRRPQAIGGLMRCAGQIRLASSSRVSASLLRSDPIAGFLGSDTSSSGRAFGSVANSQSGRARPSGSAAS